LTAGSPTPICSGHRYYRYYTARMNVFYALERYEQPHTEQASSFGKSALSFSFSLFLSLSLYSLP